MREGRNLSRGVPFAILSLQEGFFPVLTRPSWKRSS
jgi:hypothetical protein